jgi:endogenous inhibitor of DNA gyrase (YacG/DUF329 family)
VLDVLNEDEKFRPFPKAKCGLVDFGKLGNSLDHV